MLVVSLRLDSLRLMLRRIVTAVRLLPGLVSGGWTRQYEDARIILEQNGDLHYLNVSGRVQRLLVRGGIVGDGGDAGCNRCLVYNEHQSHGESR